MIVPAAQRRSPALSSTMPGASTASVAGQITVLDPAFGGRLTSLLCRRSGAEASSKEKRPRCDRTGHSEHDEDAGRRVIYIAEGAEGLAEWHRGPRPLRR